MDKWLTIVTDEYQQTGGKYGSALKLAKRMNVQPPTLNKWLSGTEAKFDAGIQALERLGWNFERARPDYIPDVDRAEVCASRCF